MVAAFVRQREIALVLVVAFREIARKSDVFAQHPEGERAGRGIGFDDADAVVRHCLAHAAREHPATEAGVRDKMPAEEPRRARAPRSEEHTSELPSLMRISYSVFCLKNKQKHKQTD